MERGLQGDYIPNTTTSERFLAFVPRPLPPVPPLQLDSNLYDLIERANRALGRLDGLTTLLPEPSLFLYLYVRKEALQLCLKTIANGLKLLVVRLILLYDYTT